MHLTRSPTRNRSETEQRKPLLLMFVVTASTGAASCGASSRTTRTGSDNAIRGAIRRSICMPPDVRASSPYPSCNVPGLSGLSPAELRYAGPFRLLSCRVLPSPLRLAPARPGFACHRTVAIVLPSFAQICGMPAELTVTLPGGKRLQTGRTGMTGSVPLRQAPASPAGGTRCNAGRLSAQAANTAGAALGTAPPALTTHRRVATVPSFRDDITAGRMPITWHDER